MDRDAGVPSDTRVRVISKFATTKLLGRLVDDEAMPTRAELAAVENTRGRGAHDRHAWVGLFTPGGQVEDPVGSRPHRGRHAIERFYATFIGPRDITFHRDADVVVGNTVVRDLELEVTMADSLVMGSPPTSGMTSRAPATTA